jgi:RimJ/RimL family protein N-acetyltransferase
MIELKILKGSEEDIAGVQRVLEEAPTYSLNISGKLPSPEDAKGMFSDIPNGRSFDDKFIFGIYLDNEMIGCIALLRGYPDETTVMLGLLLLSEKYQRKEFGTQAHKKLEEIVKGWENFEKIRIGVLITNQEILPFWKKMGYIEKDRNPYKHGDIETEVITLEKPVG